MKIKELKLHPFAGTKDRTVNFKPGLNVILGANEAGKSTLIKGLRCLFFTSPDLSPVRLGKEINPYLPVTGGDTIRISADIDLQGEDYRIEKEFGGVKKARLILPTQSELNNIAQVEIELAKMLGFSKATYEQVLITYQTDLAQTIQTLQTETDGTGAALANRLREALYDLDGIPVDKLKAEADAQAEAYFANWDENKNAPRDGKDINNPHKRNVGFVLDAYYNYRKLEKQLLEAEQYEQQIDLLNSQLQTVNKKLEELLAYKTQFAPLVEDARKRQMLENELKMLVQQKSVIAEVSEKWPVEQNKLQEARKRRDDETLISQTLEQQIEILNKYQKSLEARLLYNKVKNQIAEYNSERDNFNSLKEVNNNHLKIARTIENELKALQNIIENQQKLKIAIKSTKDIELKIQRDIKPQEEVNLMAENWELYFAQGRFQLDYPDFTLIIAPENIDLKKIQKDIEKKKNELIEFLQQWDAKDIDGLEVLKDNYSKASFKLASLNEGILRQLNGQKFADLENQVSEIKDPGIKGSIDILREKYKQSQAELISCTEKGKASLHLITEWEQKFGSKDALLDKLLDNKTALQNIENQIAHLKSLPENITNSQAFLDEFNRKIAELDRVQNEEINLTRKRIELDRNQPEDSTEDLNDKLIRAKNQFENILRRGKAYKRVQTELNTILEELDKDTFTPLKERTEYYFHKLTGGKYQTLRMDETVPADIELNGAWLPANLLSTGTLDLLALATRLAMADFYLSEKGGFIVLDDPLVNLDPERQEMTAKCLREIAEEKQVIVLTCHPSNAAMLQGDLIEL